MMNTRAIATEYRLSHWAGVMRERQESGLSIKEFCETSGFHQNIYFYWQRKLREAACRQLLPATQDKIETVVAPPGWTTCKLEPGKTESQNSVAIEIGKFRVMAANDTNEETLLKVCRTLERLC